MSNYKGYEMKALDKWYENKKSFPCECLCKFKPNDEKYEVATIVKFFPNNGWYEFVGDNKNTYSIAIPIAELEALQQTKSCEWHLGDYDQNSWISKCGAEFILIEGMPSENGMKFCHKCGRKLIQLETEKDEEDEHE